MRKIYLVLIAAAMLAPAHAQRRLVWSDEFNGPAGTPPDPAKWTYDLGGGGWGNSELEVYTSNAANVYQDGAGNLVISALHMPDGSYTSARLKTQTLFTIQYGVIEARIKIPFGQGLWPAFWMLGDNITTVSWPTCGEIDIMENIGREPSVNHGSMHGPGYSGGNAMTSTFALPNGVPLSNDYHVFAIEWLPDAVIFSVDRRKYFHVRPQDLPAGTKWVYDHPFFLLLNVAVGGQWPGYPDATTSFPQTMLVDWVRIYAIDGFSSAAQSQEQPVHFR